MPKGVECPDAGCVNLALSFADYFDLIPGMDAEPVSEAACSAPIAPQPPGRERPERPGEGRSSAPGTGFRGSRFKMTRDDTAWISDLFASCTRDWTPASARDGACVLYTLLVHNPEASRRCGSVLSESERRRAERFVTEDGPISNSGARFAAIAVRSRLARHGRCRSSLSGRPIQATPIFPTRPTSGLAFHPAGLVFSERGHPPTVSVSILRIGRRPGGG
jgi:hypothetical protein